MDDDEVVLALEEQGVRTPGDDVLGPGELGHPEGVDHVRGVELESDLLPHRQDERGRLIGRALANRHAGVVDALVEVVEAPAPRQDPLAQSFNLPAGNGLFVTKIDLYFAAKDDVLPVTVQLRPMSLGLPTETVYPFSEVSIDPKDVNISDDGSVKTTVTFPSPVYLKGGEEHAVILLSESTSYQVWISRLGEVDRTTADLPEAQQIFVTEQPLLGSLFKSQNASTWDPSQYEDLKFSLYQAVFTDQLGDINFYNPQLNIGNKQIANLLVNPLEMNSRKIRVGLGTTVTSTDFIVGTTDRKSTRLNSSHRT